jgi:hypothetical protein
MDATTLHGEDLLHMTTYSLEGVAIRGHTHARTLSDESPSITITSWHLKLQVLQLALRPEITFLKITLKSQFSGRNLVKICQKRIAAEKNNVSDWN